VGVSSPTSQQRTPESPGDESLGAELLAVVARLNRLATQRIRLPLPVAQARLLATIMDQGPARISDLATLDHCSQPTMTTQVRRLEEAGLVSRSPDPTDARAVRISITPAGERTVVRSRADRGAAIDPYIERLSDEERGVLTEAIGIMRRLIAEAGGHQPSGRR